MAQCVQDTTDEKIEDEVVKGMAAIIKKDGGKKPYFFDMVHSNNAARIRLWLGHKGMSNTIDSKMIVYADLQTKEFAKVNPLKKVPGFVTSGGTTLFESFVIMQYIEDKYGHLGPKTVMDTPEDRAFVQLIVRCHDLYIASPNNTQPGFSHTQGCMYLAPYETVHCPARRCMSNEIRAKKLAEIFKQLTWLEAQIKAPYMAGDRLTHADFTWFPTCVFMEYMLPRVFGWPEVFREDKVFPKLAKWYSNLDKSNPIFTSCRKDIWDFWVKKDKAGQFDAVKTVLTDDKYKWKYP